MIPALAAVFSKLNGLACFLAPLLPAPLLPTGRTCRFAYTLRMLPALSSS